MHAVLFGDLFSDPAEFFLRWLGGLDGGLNVTLERRVVVPFILDRADSSVVLGGFDASRKPSHRFPATAFRPPAALVARVFGFVEIACAIERCFGLSLGGCPVFLAPFLFLLGFPLGAMLLADRIELGWIALRRVEPVRQLLFKLHRQNVDVQGRGLVFVVGHDAHAACRSGTSPNDGALPAQASQPFQAVPATTTSRSLWTLMP